jgi:hypothetical protein
MGRNPLQKAAAGVLIAMLASVAPAYAADLNYSIDTTIIVNGLTVTVKANSTATSLVIGTNSLTVAVPAGGQFRLVSSNRYTFASDDPTIGENCTGTDNSITVSQNKTVVITPSSTICTAGTPGIVVTPSSGGGGGGASSAPSSAPSSSAPSTSQPAAQPSVQPQVPVQAAQPVVTTDAATQRAAEIVQIGNEAARVMTQAPEKVAEAVGAVRDIAQEKKIDTQIVSRIVSADVKPSVREDVKTFVAYGTETTTDLGAGERAGVVNSFKAALGRLPESETDWQDVIKIANGRFPSQTNPASEKRAEQSFQAIYKRAPDRKNPNDDAAVVVMAYGLRPANRNFASEQAAIKSYRATFQREPKSATAWDAVRAIAYSGAKR